MSMDYWVLAGVWILSGLLIFCIPKDKVRIAIMAFLFKQMQTYPLGLMAVEWGLLAYPVRELAEINRTSFTYEFWAYPMVCALSIAYFPQYSPRWKQLGYYALFTTGLTIIEVVLERFTNVIEYIHWYWFFTWATVFLTFLFTQLFCTWFFTTLWPHPHGKVAPSNTGSYGKLPPSE